MSRICVEPDSTALHVAAVCLDCTSCQAREKISRLEAFTSYGCDGKTQLGLADLDETMHVFLATDACGESGAEGEGESESNKGCEDHHDGETQELVEDGSWSGSE